MAEVDNRQSNISTKSFDEYMMNALQSSKDYVIRMQQRSQQTINYFLGLFTALAGGGIVVLATVQDEFLKFSILAFDLAMIAGFGTLTYLWILVYMGHTRQENCRQFFLHKYFRDKDPLSFKKYGLSDLLIVYRRTYDKEDVPTLLAPIATYVSLIVLIIFNTSLFACAVYLGWSLFTGKGSTLFAIIIGIAYLLLAAAAWLIVQKRVLNRHAKGLEIVKKYHDNQIDGDVKE